MALQQKQSALGNLLDRIHPAVGSPLDPLSHSIGQIIRRCKNLRFGFSLQKQLFNFLH